MSFSATRNAKLFVSILIGVLLVPILGFASPQPSFQCNVSAHPPHPTLKRNGYEAGEFIYYGGDFIAFTAYPETASDKLLRVESGSGEKYSDGVLTFHSKGNDGLLSIANGPTYNCVSASSQVIANAKALETIVRSGPSVNASRLDKLPLNEPLELIGQSGEYYQDYQWFKVRYGEGQEGYAWGGTLCVETELSGILIGCSQYSQNNGSQTNNGENAVGQSLFGSKVRAQPSASSRQLFSIAQGAPIQVIEETGSFFDGWQWVKVQSNSGAGFVWGGTICTTNKQLVGVHFGCN